MKEESMIAAIYARKSTEQIGVNEEKEEREGKDHSASMDEQRNDEARPSSACSAAQYH